MPEAVLRRLHEGRGLFSLEEERPEYRELAALAQEMADLPEGPPELDDDGPFSHDRYTGSGSPASAGLPPVEASASADFSRDLEFATDDVSGEDIPLSLSSRPGRKR